MAIENEIARCFRCGAHVHIRRYAGKRCFQAHCSSCDSDGALSPDAGLTLAAAIERWNERNGRLAALNAMVGGSA